MSLLLALPPEIRLQIWSHIVRPTVVHPCTCAEKALQCHQANQVNEDDDNCCQSTASPYNRCDNQLLRVNRLIFNEVQPLFDRTEKERIYVLCNSLCLDNFSNSLTEGAWRSVRHLRVDLFVGWGNDCRDDWFLGQSHRWAKRYVAGALSKYEDQGRPIVVEPAEEVNEDSSGRRTLTVDIHFPRGPWRASKQASNGSDITGGCRGLTRHQRSRRKKHNPLQSPSVFGNSAG